MVILIICFVFVRMIEGLCNIYEIVFSFTNFLAYTNTKTNNFSISICFVFLLCWSNVIFYITDCYGNVSVKMRVDIKLSGLYSIFSCSFSYIKTCDIVTIYVAWNFRQYDVIARKTVFLT